MRSLITFSAAIVFSSLVFAGSDTDKIGSDFDSLDNDGDAYISQEEADDDNIADHFEKIDSDQDGQLSKEEYVTYIEENPDSVESDKNLMEEGE